MTRFSYSLILGLILVSFSAERVVGQGVRIRPPSVLPPNSLNSVSATQPSPWVNVYQPQLVQVPGTATAPPATLGTPSFDPYGAPSSQPVFPSLFGNQPYSPYANTPPVFTTPGAVTPGTGLPGAPASGFPSTTGIPPAIGIPPVSGPPAPGQPALGASPYGMSPGSPWGVGTTPSSPNSLFPNGMFTGNTYDPNYGTILKLIQHPRLSHTYLYGTDGRDVAINDTEVAISLAFPNFLFSGQPIYISPTFALHLWDGPQPPVISSLPGNAYSGYLDMYWRSDPNQIIGGELSGAVGAYTDFDTFTSDSIRLLGTALLTLRMTPAVQFKLGITYLDRVDLKILPAGGILWEPNPQTRFDIYFPRPKLAQYLTTVGTADLWWYLSGEYGGGSWTIEYAPGNYPAGGSDRIDINDLRVMLGMDWYFQSGVKSFLEVGYVFEREVIYNTHPLDNFNPSDTIMFRGGIAF